MPALLEDHRVFDLVIAGEQEGLGCGPGGPEMGGRPGPVHGPVLPPQTYLTFAVGPDWRVQALPARTQVVTLVPGQICARLPTVAV